MMEMKSGELSGVMDKPLSAAEATWKGSEHRNRDGALIGAHKFENKQDETIHDHPFHNNFVSHYMHHITFWTAQ